VSQKYVSDVTQVAVDVVQFRLQEVEVIILDATEKIWNETQFLL
jgi:hypothetical protein